MRKIGKIAGLIILFNSCFVINGAAVSRGPYGRELSVQDPGIEKTVRGLLKSQRSQDRAWGAYIIGNENLKNLSPLLIKLLENGDPDKSIEEGLVIHCALDSLIQLRQSIPAKMVSSLFSRFPNETLILAAANPKETQGALLGLIMEDRTDLQWFAISDILTNEKTPGFASLLVRGLEIKVSVEVVDALTNSGFGEGVGMGCSSCCGGGSGPINGYPPIGMYRIDDKPDQQDGLVSDGRHPVFYQRRLVAAGDWFGNCGGCFTSGSRSESKVDYLSDMLGVEPSKLGINWKEFFTIEWHTAQQFQSEMARLKKALDITYRNLVIRLADKGLVSNDDVDTLQPNLSIRVVDLRGDRSIRLPKIK